jgi:hypothetical protein
MRKAFKKLTNGTAKRRKVRERQVAAWFERRTKQNPGGPQDNNSLGEIIINIA